MIKVLRLGHRVGRDDRISTHVGLTARQWGADEVIFSGDKDGNMLKSQVDIIERWGGDISINYTKEWKNEITSFEGLVVHLTMYGEKINTKMSEIRDNYESSKNIMIIVGSEKVSKWVYNNVDYNISVGTQPHSEIAALAVFMDRLMEKNIKENFCDSKIEVEPSKNQKLTRET